MSPTRNSSQLTFLTTHILRVSTHMRPDLSLFYRTALCPLPPHLSLSSILSPSPHQEVNGYLSGSSYVPGPLNEHISRYSLGRYPPCCHCYLLECHIRAVLFRMSTTGGVSDDTEATEAPDAPQREEPPVDNGPSVGLNLPESQLPGDPNMSPPSDANDTSPTNNNVDPTQPENQSQPIVSPAEDDTYDDFPSELTCPLTFEPPARGVRFLIPDAEGHTNRQCFEYSFLFRNVFTAWGGERNRQFVRHPLTSAKIRRDRALQYFEPVTAEEQAEMHRKRGDTEDRHPLGHEDFMRMNTLHQNVQHE